jgi:hypothetical protein
MTDQERVPILLTREEQQWLTSLLTAQIRDDRARVSRLYREGKSATVSRKSVAIYTAIAHKVKTAAIADQLREAADGQ